MYKQQLIEFLVRTEALRFGEFKTKSGRMSPYFINAGSFNLGSHAEQLGGFYADCIFDVLSGEFDVMFGPAYKGIPLVLTASTAMYRKYSLDKSYCFNRKEIKDHGEGGIFLGAKLKDGDRVIIIEDVVTSGTAVREVMPLLTEAAKVDVRHMFVMVDRLEVGLNGRSAPEEIYSDFGITVHPVITTRDIIDYLYNREIDGKIFIDDAIRGRMEDYLKLYGRA